ncbi:MAG: M20 family metallopeptidase [Myxococcota bacterium]|nr:M20 family metallopeptidase [Myxococcota bacterium]
MSELEPLLESARKLQPDVVALRRAIHAEPELGLDLPKTQARVLAALEPLGLETRLHERTSGIVATLRGARPGPTLLLRADMDALPMSEDNDLPFRSRHEGRMHACGHDAHTAMLTGAARLLAERREELMGNVVFMFQPGEEGHFGAHFMIEEGVLEGVDAAFAIHITPLLPPGRIGTRSGPLMASADVFSASIRGRGGHASMPHDCADPIPVACEAVQALQSFVTRRINVFDPVVLTVSKIQAGTTNNVIPESAEIQGTLRALSPASRERAVEGLQDVIRGVAAAHGLEAETRHFAGYPVTANDAGFARFSLDVARDLLGARGAIEMPSPVMGAEDFSYVLEKVPGAMVFLGVRPSGVEHPAPCHSNRMLLDEDGMAAGTALHAAVAMRFLERGGLGG